MKLNPNKILLIDDDAISSSINKFTVSSTGLFNDVIIKSTGKDALDFLKEEISKRENLPSILLVDIYMPDYDGFELIDLIDELFEDNNIELQPHLIILSDSKFIKDIEQFDKTPTLEHFLKKPLTKEVFENTLKELKII